jgi:uncharacterized protein
MVNGTRANIKIAESSYAEVKRNWKKGDRIQLVLPMKASIIEANPLVEETRNQVTVKRGPVVYCLEAVDLAKDQKVFDVALPANIQLTPKMISIDSSNVLALQGKAKVINKSAWKNTLYKEVSSAKPADVMIKLVPYYAWGNRGHGDMSVWLPVIR